jgi:hypothetical protein
MVVVVVVMAETEKVGRQTMAVYTVNVHSLNRKTNKQLKHEKTKHEPTEKKIPRQLNG